MQTVVPLLAVLLLGNGVAAFTPQGSGRARNTWQARLDRALLDVDLSTGGRVRLLQKALTDPKLADDVVSAASTLATKGFGKGHPEVIDTLWPTGTQARADIEALASLRKTVPEALEKLQEKPPKVFSQPPSPQDVNIDPAEVVTALSSLATDRKKQEELRQEALNVFRSTPKGLETPKYSVLRCIEGPKVLGRPEVIELREYAPFTVARKAMVADGAGGADAADGGAFGVLFGGTAGAKGFNSLAAYLFGENEESAAMAMTMPVEISAAAAGDGAVGGGGSMAFVLPEANAANPPTPRAGSDVEIARVPARLVACKPFPGLVTDAEVERQREALLAAIAADGAATPVDEKAVSVLQYNGPFTLPWRRRNEVALVVTIADETEEAPAAEDEAAEAAPEAAAADVQEAAQGPADDEVAMEADSIEWPAADGTVSSWYDAGVRL